MKTSEIIANAERFAKEAKQRLEISRAARSKSRYDGRKLIFQKGDIITKDNLADLPFYTPILLGGGMQAIRLPDTGDVLNFWNIWEPGAAMTLHSHDCRETVKIISGELIVKDSLYQSGNVLKYAPYVPHIVRASMAGKATFLVEFQ